jgi:hypothetical protein
VGARAQFGVVQVLTQQFRERQEGHPLFAKTLKGYPSDFAEFG